jgi:hypothetical protein
MEFFLAWTGSWVGVYIAQRILAFLLYGAIATLVYIPVLKKYGVTKKVVQRSLKVGLITAGILVVTNSAISFLIGGYGLILSIAITTYYSGNYLCKNLTIKPRIAYFTGFGVVLFSVLAFFGIGLTIYMLK